MLDQTWDITIIVCRIIIIDGGNYFIVVIIKKSLASRAHQCTRSKSKCIKIFFVEVACNKFYTTNQTCCVLKIAVEIN